MIVVGIAVERVHRSLAIINTGKRAFPLQQVLEKNALIV